MKKRVFALLLCLLLCLSILPVGAFADDYCEHDIVKMEAKATCGEAHREHYKCTKCGKLFSDERGEHEISYESVAQAKPVHTTGLAYVAPVAPTCTTGGNEEYWVCTECGQMFYDNPKSTEEGKDISRTNPIPDDQVRNIILSPLGHNMTFHEAVPHTCTQDGNVAYYQCSNCWWSFSDPEGLNPLSSVTDSAAHVKTEYPAVAPTCDTDGNSYYFYCNVCEKYYDENSQEISESSWVIPAGHDYEEHPFQEPTCTAGGNRLYYTCSGCDKVFDADLNETTLEAVTLNMIPHSLVIHVPAVAKSCYTNGNVEYWQCASCGAKFADAEGTLPLTDEEVVIPACHEFEATPAKEATCTEPGNIAYWTCTVEGCGIVVDESGNQVWETAVPAAGHKPVKVERTTTCTEAGVAEHYKCEACGKLFQDESCTVEKTLEDLQEAAPGHEYDWEGWCTRCKAVSPDAPAFNPGPVTVPNNDNTYVVVTVTAPEGVFPANCQLSVQPVFVVDDQTKEAVDAERQEGKTVAKSFTYDIKVLKNGEEIQPADGSKVKVSFALAAAANTNLDATVYHVTDDGAKALETSVEGETVSAETDGFSLYTVEFTYQELQYVLPGGETVPLSTVLDTLQLSGEVQGVTVSNPELFSCEMVDGVWTVFSHQSFQTDEWMNVTLDGIPYNIKVTDANEFTVSFEMNGHGTQVPSQQVDLNGKATKPADPSESGYIFGGWYADSGLKTQFTFNEEIKKDTTVYARWRCIVTYNAEPGTVTISSTTRSVVRVYKNVNDKATEYTPNPLDGYIVDENWYTDEARKMPFDFNTPITKDTTLYANYIPIINEQDSGKTEDGRYALALNYDYDTYKDSVKVSVDNTELKMEQYTLTKGSQGDLIATLTKEYISGLADGNHTMKVATSEGAGERAFHTASGIVTDECIISFKNKVEGASSWPIDYTVPVSGMIKRPNPDPKAGDYVFDDWYADAGLKTKFDFTKAITSDTDIYAKWRCRVTFSTLHGTTPPAQIVDINAKATQPADLSWIGYTWGGWYTDTAWTNAFDFKTPITRDTVLYARWIPDLRITDGNGGTAHYGSTYAFTLNYYYPDWNKNSSKFKVAVGGHNGTSATEISKNDYAITRGAGDRVVVTLRATYIRTLTDGATYDIVFDTGLVPYEYDAGEYPPIDLGATVGNFKVSKSPKTGDESNVALWAAIAGVSLIAVVVIVAVLLNKRKKGKKAPTPPETRSADKTKKPPKE